MNTTIVPPVASITTLVGPALIASVLAIGQGPAGAPIPLGAIDRGVVFNNAGVSGVSPNLQFAANGQVQIVSPGTTNQYALNITNVGAGTAGLSMAWASGGDFFIGDAGSRMTLTVRNHGGWQFSTAGSGNLNGSFSFATDATAQGTGGPNVCFFNGSTGARGSDINHDGSLTLWKQRTDASNYERLDIGVVSNRFDIIGSSAGTGAARDVRIGTAGNAPVYLVTNNTPRWAADTSGHLVAISDNAYDIGAAASTRPRNIHVGSGVIAGGHITAGSASAFQWPAKSNITSPVDGNILLRDAATTAFGLLQFGGTAATFPALKRNVTELQVRLADDSGYGGLAASNVYAFGIFNSSGATVLASSSVGINATTGDVSVYGPAFIGWTSGVSIATATSNAVTRLYRGADHVVEQRNGANAQARRLFNTYTDISNGEWLEESWATNVALIRTQQNGTGQFRTLKLTGGNGNAQVQLDDSVGALIGYGGNRMSIDVSHAIFTCPIRYSADNAIDLGLVGNRVRTGYFGTSVVTPALETTPTTVAGLPAAASGNKSHRRFVTDANATLTAGIGAVVAGGGANNVPVYSDGAAWRIG